MGYFLWLKDRTDTIKAEKPTANMSVSATVMASPPLWRKELGHPSYSSCTFTTKL